MVSPTDRQEHHDFYTNGKVEFPFDDVDRSLIGAFFDGEDAGRLVEEISDSSLKGNLSTALLKSLETMLPLRLEKASAKSGGSAQAIGLRVIALLWMLESGCLDIGDSTLLGLADILGVKRQTLSCHVRFLEDSLGIHARQQKPTASVETYRSAASESWEKRKSSS